MSSSEPVPSLQAEVPPQQDQPVPFHQPSAPQVMYPQQPMQTQVPAQQVQEDKPPPFYQPAGPQMMYPQQPMQQFQIQQQVPRIEGTSCLVVTASVMGFLAILPAIITLLCGFFQIAKHKDHMPNWLYLFGGLISIVCGVVSGITAIVARRDGRGSTAMVIALGSLITITIFSVLILGFGLSCSFKADTSKCIKKFSILTFNYYFGTMVGVVAMFFGGCCSGIGSIMLIIRLATTGRA